MSYSSTSSDPAERATAHLIHYIELACGRQLNADCHSELAMIVDDIVAASTRQVRQLEARLAQLEKTVAILD